MARTGPVSHGDGFFREGCLTGRGGLGAAMVRGMEQVGSEDGVRQDRGFSGGGGGRSDVRQWRVNRVTDTVGNYLTVSYREVDGNAYPERIDYTGHETSGAPYASVRFEYERRHDVQVAYVGGSRVRVDQRLTNVKTYYGERLVTNYWLTYSTEACRSRRGWSGWSVVTGPATAFRQHSSPGMTWAMDLSWRLSIVRSTREVRPATPRR